MTDPAFKAFWPKEQVGVGIDESPKHIDLAKPDASAAELAEKLQKVPMNFLFGKIALFAGKWIIRPLIWWPIRSFFFIASYILAAQKQSPETERQNRRNRRQALRSAGYDV